MNFTDFIDNFGAIIAIISALCLLVLAITQVTKTKKDDAKAKQIINLLERVLQKDLDKDGDIGK